LDLTSIVDALLFLLFLGLSALFFAGEFAFFSVSKDELDRRSDRRTRRALKMLARPDELMIQLLLASTASSVLTALFALRIVWHHTDRGNARTLASIICLILVSVVIATLARLLPRVHVAKNPEEAVRSLARPIYVMVLPLYPLVQVILLVTRRLFLAGAQAREMFLKAGQLRAIARVSEKTESGADEEKEMINAIFEMRETVVREVMVPRIDMLCAEVTTTAGEAIKVIADGGHSRIPIYNKTIDDIRGILHARDLFDFVYQGGLDAGIDGILREAYFVPETKKVSDLLAELRKRKTHMAIAVDEFGGVVGLVTLEDVLEEIVGEIYDEHEEELELVHVVNDDEVRVDGKVRIDDLNETLRTDIAEEEDYDTLAGYVYNLLGKVPSEGDAYEADGLRFVVEKVTGQRIERVIIRGAGVGATARENSER
jgi:putative hemolysin